MKAAITTTAFAVLFSFLSQVALAASPSCDLEFSELKVCADVEWLVGPSLREANELTINFVDRSSGRSIEPRELAMDLWMPAHGHGSRPVVLTQGSQRSSFAVSDMYFVMPGHWQVRVTLKTAEGTEQQNLDVTL